MISKKLVFPLIIIILVFINIDVNSSEDIPLLVAGDNINVRREPNTNSEILYKLRIGRHVKLIKRSGKKEKIDNNEGEWIFIDTDHFKEGTRETIKGWVFDYYLLSDFSKFKRVFKLKFEKCIFNFTQGDSNFYFEIYKNGTYESKNKDLYLNKEGDKSKGTIYKYNNLVMLKTQSGDIDIFFYINSEGYLCSTWFLGTIECSDCSECSKCKWE